ncbi:MAG: hypothetical protein GC154_05775 [bacterium]|nr:hypothetical protein [bacterium]
MKRLSFKSKRVLELIAQGVPCVEILARNADINLQDIAYAAQEALQVNEQLKIATGVSLLAFDGADRTRTDWTQEEDQLLRDLRDEQMSIVDIAKRLRRQPSCIYNRLFQLGMIHKPANEFCELAGQVCSKSA